MEIKDTYPYFSILIGNFMLKSILYFSGKFTKYVYHLSYKALLYSLEQKNCFKKQLSNKP